MHTKLELLNEINNIIIPVIGNIICDYTYSVKFVLDQEFELKKDILDNGCICMSDDNLVLVYSDAIYIYDFYTKALVQRLSNILRTNLNIYLFDNNHIFSYSKYITSNYQYIYAPYSCIDSKTYDIIKFDMHTVKYDAEIPKKYSNKTTGLMSYELPTFDTKYMYTDNNFNIYPSDKYIAYRQCELDIKDVKWNKLWLLFEDDDYVWLLTQVGLCNKLIRYDITNKRIVDDIHIDHDMNIMEVSNVQCPQNRFLFKCNNKIIELKKEIY